MKTPDTKSLDQADATTLQAQLSLHAANLRATLATTAGETIQEPLLASGDVLKNINMLTAHISELEHRLGDSAPVFNPPSGKPTAKNSDSSKPVAKKQTLTEKVLAQRGCKTLGELATLPISNND